MKNKASLILSLSSVFLLAACNPSDGGGEKEPPHVHSWGELVTRVEPTCTAEGKKAFYECACGVVANENHVIVEESTLTIPKIPHNYVDDCNETMHFKKCSMCNDIIDEEPHTFESDYDSLNHWQVCTECGYETEAAGHSLGDWVTDDTNHWKTCTDCDGKIQEAAHNWEMKYDGTKHWEECSVCKKTRNETAHTMTTQKDGSQHWTACTCGYTTEKVDHAATGDYLGDDNNHWKLCSCGEIVGVEPHTLFDNHDSTNHWQECSVCGRKVGETAHQDTVSHNLAQHWQGCSCGYGTTPVDHDGTWVKVSDPSENTAGVMSMTCSTCGDLTHEHTYGDPTWEWDDYNGATLTMSCSDTNCLSTYPGHTFTKYVEATSQTNDATYEAAGKTTYTVSFDNNGTVISDTKEVEIPMKSFNYKDIKCDQANFWHYINFGAWGDPWKVDGNVVGKGNQLNVLGDKLFSQAQEDGYKYAIIRYNVKSLVNGEEPKAIVPWHGGYAFDDKTSVSLTKVGDIYEAEAIVDLKCYLYDIDNTFKLGLSLYVSNDATDKTTLGHIISEVEFTIKGVEFMEYLPFSKGYLDAGKVSYDENGLMTSGYIENTGDYSAAGWESTTAAFIAGEYLDELYTKGYRSLRIDYVSDDLNGKSLYALRKNHNNEANVERDIKPLQPYVTEIFESNNEKLVIDLVDLGNGHRATGRADFAITASTQSFAQLQAAVELGKAFTDAYWPNYFAFGEVLDVGRSSLDTGYVKCKGGNLALTPTFIKQIFAAGYTKMTCNLKIHGPDAGHLVNHYVYITNDTGSANAWNAVYSEGDCVDNTAFELTIDFSALVATMNDTTSVLISGRNSNSATPGANINNCEFEISKLSFAA